MKEVFWDPGEANPKQRLFFASRALFTAYGGAKGGGKTWAVRVKAVGGALQWPGIRILIMRRTYPELEENHIRPVLGMVPKEAARYTASSRLLTFLNGSTIRFGHWQGELSEREYQGQEFDWIFLDEATQFTERAFSYLGGCLRGVNDIPKRMYLTMNPGGVGHAWVKRLFIDRDFRRGLSPEEDEDPADYVFIPATVEDNVHLMKASPGYLRMLAAMPEDLRRAYRYGDWNALGGAYFPELRREKHTVRPFAIPPGWRRYRALDYGLDMLACCWVAVDETGRSWVYRELKEPGLIVSEAARRIRDLTPEGEEITATFAPPDLWSRQKDTGRTMEELFALGGVPLVKAANDRVQGHMLLKEALALRADGRPGLLFFDTVTGFFRDLAEIQADGEDPSDCAREPHAVTHAVDALRYYAVSRRLAAGREPGAEAREEREEAAPFFGGEAEREYLTY